MTNNNLPQVENYERVYTVSDYFDGPRSGIADFFGRPHHYESMFDEANDTYLITYELRAFDDATLQLALEEWDIWLRWDEASKAGSASVESHPALPRDRDRYRQITNLLKEWRSAAGEPVRAIGNFRRTERLPSGWEVHWDLGAE